MLYLDLDGVLADFDGQLKNYGVNKNDTSFIHTHPSGWTDEQIKLDSEVRKCMGTPGFWEQMPICPGALELFDYVKHFHPIILTAVPNILEYRDRIEKEKATWILKNLGFVFTIFCLRSQKQDYVRDNKDILVDDMIQNIKEWNKAGGTGVLHEDAWNTIKRLSYLFEEVL